jgi:hypothetical protein
MPAAAASFDAAAGTPAVGAVTGDVMGVDGRTGGDAITGSSAVVSVSAVG